MSRALVPLLSAVPALSGLPTDDLAAIADACQELHLRAGDVLFAEGDDDPRLMFVLRGGVELSRGKRSVGSVGPGGVVGVLETIGRAPRTATVSARERSQVALLRAASLELLSLSHAPVGLAMQQLVVGALLDELLDRQRELAS